jgi:hypothetical protein
MALEIMIAYSTLIPVIFILALEDNFLKCPLN